MGLFDQIVSGALRGAMGQGGEGGLLPGMLGQLLGRTSLGGVGGLLSQLQQGGLGDQVSSWLGNGANAAISPDQLRNALGNEHLQQMARSAGLPVDQLLAMLAQHLPGAVDKMSPNGALDESAATDGGAQDDAQGGGSLADQAGLGDVGR
jgi:uncharacterized protein YidB (DUF937 family)